MSVGLLWIIYIYLLYVILLLLCYRIWSVCVLVKFIAETLIYQTHLIRSSVVLSKERGTSWYSH
jgi:hypothetical protein